jgi:serine/threonine-protein kinase
MVGERSPEGRVVGAYRLVRELGSGGMGVVYEAVHTQWGTRAAVKLLHPTLTAHASARSRLLREIQAAAQIRHPNVVRVFDAAATDDGVPYVVMELLEGSDMAVLLARRGRLPVSEAIDLLLPVASAVHAAHRAGVIHRDLKPANIVVARRGLRWPEPVVTDFGTSKVLGEQPADALTKSDGLLGTIHYMAPEQTRGATHATAASDQYALAAILYECLAGSRPFVGESAYDLMHAIVTSRVTPLKEHAPDLDPELERIVLRALSRDSAARFADVSALGAALLPWASARAQAIWGPELEGPVTEHTLADGDSVSLVVSMRSARPRRHWPIAVGALLAVGGAILGSRMGQRPAAASVGCPEASAPVCPAPGVVSAVCPAVDPPLAVTPLPAAPTARAPAARRPSVAAAAPPAAAPAPPPPPAPAIPRGKNEAPILE